MISIKKVSVSPIPRNEASVIDSLNTNDDKTINAPSIRAVNEGLNSKANTGHTHDDRYYKISEIDNKLAQKVSNLSDNSTTLNLSNTGTVTIVRRGNTVTAYAEATVTAGGSLVSNYITLPDWARPVAPALATMRSTVGTDMNMKTAHEIMITNGTTLNFSVRNSDTLNTINVKNFITYVTD